MKKTKILVIEAFYRPTEGNHSEFEINRYFLNTDQILNLKDVKEKLKNTFSETAFKKILKLAGQYNNSVK